MSDRPAITQQYAFTVSEDGETEGGIEPAEESVETSLESFGADVDHRERDTRIEQPEATSFGVDDRKTVTRGDGGEQRALFADTDDDQRTLTGERASGQCLFESDTDDEPAATATGGVPIETHDEPSTRAVADGGRDIRKEVSETNNTATNSVNAGKTDKSVDVTVAIPRMKLAEVADYVGYERNTVERHARKGPKTAELTAYVEECRAALSALDDTDDDGHISRVVAAGAADELQKSAERHHGNVEQKLRELVGVLRRALDGQEHPPTDAETAASVESESEDENDDTTFDAENETVTEAWEGAFLSASWGYDQTNVELAQIVKVSDSGKTVLARRVTAERVGHGRTSNHLRPTAEQFGDEFRLHVRNSGGDPAFRGTYPLSGGNMDDSPTRRGWFSPFDNKAENSIRETATNYGH